MDELIKQYLEENYFIIFSTIHSYYCMDKTTKEKLHLTNLESEVRLVFGNVDTITMLVYAWVASKTKRLKELLDKYGSIATGSTIEQINDIIIREQCTQLCT